MKNDTLGTLYSELTSMERVRLLLQAKAREDRAEVRRLWDSCPRQTFTMADHEVVDYWNASHLVAASFGLMWHGHYRWVVYWEMEKDRFLQSLEALAEGFDIGVGVIKRPISQNHPVQEAYGAKLRHYFDQVQEAGKELQEARARLKGTYEGLLRFCRAAGLTPEEVLAWRQALDAEIKQTRNLLECSAIPTHEKTADGVYQALCKLWPGLGQAVETA